MTKFIKLFLGIFVFGFTSCTSLEMKTNLENNQTELEPFSINQIEFEEKKLSYYSDYFSFIGRDENGWVAFAIDTNRGQDQESYQAEHFLVMFDQINGWKDLQGNGFFENTNKILNEIPSSENFHFSGSANSGLIIQSPNNNIELNISPISSVLNFTKGISKFKMGGASATLNWQNREIHGRVIYEYLFLPAFNRLTRKYFGLWNDFHGLYLTTESNQDLYFHFQKGKLMSPLAKDLTGFFVSDNNIKINTINFQGSVELSNIEWNVIERDLALGFYRWPTEWNGSFSLNGETVKFQFHITQSRSISNWIIGGFKMGFVEGELQFADGKKLKLFGLAELII